MIPTSPTWPILDFAPGLDISGFFDSTREGFDWTATPGAGWGVRYLRDGTNTKIELHGNAVASTTLVTLWSAWPTPMGPWETVVEIQPDITTGTGMGRGFVVDGGDPSTLLGHSLSLNFIDMTGLWNLRFENGAGAWVAVPGSSNLALTTAPGDVIRVRMYSGTGGVTFEISCGTNSYTFGPFPFYPPTLADAPHTQSLLYAGKDPARTSYIVSWRIREIPPLLELTPFNNGMGSRQGRIEPSSFTPPHGSHVFCLGSDAQTRYGDFVEGDGISLRQTGPLANGDVVTVKVRVRTPTVPPWPLSPGNWRFALYTTDSAPTRTKMCERVMLPGRVEEMVVGFVWTGAPDTVELEARLEYNASGLTDVFYDLELPGVWIDQVEVTPAASRLIGCDFRPHDGEQGVSQAWAHTEFTLVDSTGASAPDPLNTTVTINGQTAYTAGAFVAPFDGPDSAVTSDYLGQLRFVVNNTVPFASESMVGVNVVSQTLDLMASCNFTYQFRIEDRSYPFLKTSPPYAPEDSTRPEDLMHLIVCFNESMKMVDPTRTDDALNPANYALVALSAPAVPVTVVSVDRIDDATVRLTLDWEMTAEVEYSLTVSNAEDLNGNPVGGP